VTDATAAAHSSDARRAEVSHRIERVREVLSARGDRAALLRARRNFAWLTAGGLNHVVLASDAGEAALLVRPDGALVLTPNIEADRIRDEEVAGLDLDVIPVEWWDREAIDTAARRIAGGDVIPDAGLEEALVPLRSVLRPFDQERLAIVGGRVVTALDGVVERVTSGVTEAQIAAGLAASLVGLRTPVVLVAADERIERYRHPLPTERPVTRRVMVVVVAEGWGLHVAATRFVELEEPGSELRRRFDATRAVQAALRDATRAGATLGDAFAAAQAAYADAGFPDEWRRHHQGGTIGYQGRERVAGPDDPTLIEAGMAFAWNPSITGAKVEDTFILEPDGVRRVVGR